MANQKLIIKQWNIDLFHSSEIISWKEKKNHFDVDILMVGSFVDRLSLSDANRQLEQNCFAVLLVLFMWFFLK